MSLITGPGGIGVVTSNGGRFAGSLTENHATELITTATGLTAGVADTTDMRLAGEDR
ncbi:hypothetical protein ABH924_003310 [Arthrobacter sp. GAS37]